MDLNEGGGPHKEAKDFQSVLNDDTLREIERLSSTVIRRSMRKHAAFPEPHKVSTLLRGRYAAAESIEASDLLNEE